MDDYKYLSIKEIAKGGKYPFTMAMLRHYLLHRHINGLDQAVCKVGKRIFLRSDLLDRWIEKQRGPRT